MNHKYEKLKDLLKELFKIIEKDFQKLMFETEKGL